MKPLNNTQEHAPNTRIVSVGSSSGCPTAPHHSHLAATAGVEADNLPRLRCHHHHHLLLLLLPCVAATDLASRAAACPAAVVTGLVTCFCCVHLLLQPLLLLRHCCVVECRAAAAGGVVTGPCRCCLPASRADAAAAVAAAVGVRPPPLPPSRCRLCFWRRSSWTVAGERQTGRQAGSQFPGPASAVVPAASEALNKSQPFPAE